MISVKKRIYNNVEYAAHNGVLRAFESPGMKAHYRRTMEAIGAMPQVVTVRRVSDNTLRDRLRKKSE